MPSVPQRPSHWILGPHQENNVQSSGNQPTRRSTRWIFNSFLVTYSWIKLPEITVSLDCKSGGGREHVGRLCVQSWMLVTWVYVLHENSLSCTRVHAIRAMSIKRKETKRGRGGRWAGRGVGEGGGSREEDWLRRRKERQTGTPDLLKGLNHGCLKECQHCGIYIRFTGGKNRATTKRNLLTISPRGMVITHCKLSSTFSGL